MFTIIFALVCIVGMFLKTMYTYQAMMQAHDAKSPWAKVPLTPAPAPVPPRW